MHWLAYACWPVAWLHALGTGSDAGTWWLRGIAAGGLLAVLGAVAVRLTATGRTPDRRPAAPVPVWTACEGRGHCAELLPEVLATDDWGYPLGRDGAREPQVPDALLPHARRAVAHCPRLAP